MIIPKERNILLRPESQVAELAIRPIEQEKRALWLRHNALEPKTCLINGSIQWKTP